MRDVILAVVWSLGCCAGSGSRLKADDWTQFRGPNSTGVSSASVVLEWDANTNIEWQTELPGPGSSSPIIVGDRIFVTCYSGYGIEQDAGELTELKRHLVCLDRKTGKTIWEKQIKSAHNEDPYKGFINEHGYASSTPATDGKRVFMFCGKSGVFAFDMGGNQLWNTELGTESDPAKWGDGSSVILYKNLVLLNAANVGRSMAGLDQETGKIVWEKKDESYKNTWATPKIVHVEGRDEMVIPVPGKMFALNPATGEELWFVNSPMKDTIYGTVVEHDGVALAMGGRAQYAIGVRCGGTGDVTETHVEWIGKLPSSIGTPLVLNGRMVWATQRNVLCADCKTGKLISKSPMEGGQIGHNFDYPSPIVVGDEIVVLYETGVASVISAKGTFQQLRQNDVGEVGGRFNATPAFANGQLFLRSDKKVYAIRTKIK